MPVEIKPKAPQASPAPLPAVAVEGQPITVPNVETAPVKTAGVEPVASDGAEFEVMHTIVGAFDHGSYRAGDRIKASDLGEHANIERLVKYEALRPLSDAAAPPSKAKK